MDILNTDLNAFVTTCNNLSKELLRFGIEIDGMSDFAMEKLHRSSLQEVAQAEKYIQNEIRRFSHFSECHETALWENRQLWSFLKEGRFKFSNELFNKIEDGAFLEVYGMNSKAVYRSPNFYRKISYSIGDLFLYTWNELFKRSEVYNLQLLKALYEAFDAPVGHILYLSDIPPHRCEERESKYRMSAQTDPVLFSTIENALGQKLLVTANTVTDIWPNL